MITALTSPQYVNRIRQDWTANGGVYGDGGVYMATPANNPFAQLGPTLDLVFAGTATDPLDAASTTDDTLSLNFTAEAYQIAAQYAVWGTGGLQAVNFADIVTFTRASTATYFNSAGTLTTATTNEARLDYDPATLAARGLLIEEQRTNSIRNNTMQGAVAGTPGTLPTNWVTLGAGLGTLTQTIVGTGTSAGINYIDVRINGTTSTTSFGIGFDAFTQIAAVVGQTWTSSVYVSRVGGTTTNLTVNLRVVDRDSGGVNLGLSTLDITSTLGTTLSRFQLTRTLAGVGTAAVSNDVLFAFNSGVAIDITLRIGLPQLELGAFATSVIPTTTTALTRSADVARVNTLSPWYNATAGTVYAEFLAGVSVATQQSVFDIDNSSDVSNNRISWRMGNEFVVSAGSTVVNFFITPTASATSKWAFAFTTDDFAFSRNGNAPSTDSSGALPSGLNRMLLGNSNSSAGTFLNGYLRRVTYYPRRLANADLQTITA